MKDKATRYIEYLNKKIIPSINFKELDESYHSNEKGYMKAVLNLLHSIMEYIYEDESMIAADSELVTVPAVIKSNKGEVVLGLIDLELASYGNHYGTDLFTKYGVLSEHDTNLKKELEDYRDSFIPYDYYYTTYIEGDHHVDFDNAPSDIKDILDNFKRYHFLTKDEIDRMLENDLEL